MRDGGARNCSCFTFFMFSFSLSVDIFISKRSLHYLEAKNWFGNPRNDFFSTSQSAVPSFKKTQTGSLLSWLHQHEHRTCAICGKSQLYCHGHNINLTVMALFSPTHTFWLTAHNPRVSGTWASLESPVGRVVSVQQKGHPSSCIPPNHSRVFITLVSRTAGQLVVEVLLSPRLPDETFSTCLWSTAAPLRDLFYLRPGSVLLDPLLPF